MLSRLRAWGRRRSSALKPPGRVVAPTPLRAVRVVGTLDVYGTAVPGPPPGFTPPPGQGTPMGGGYVWLYPVTAAATTTVAPTGGGTGV